MATQSNVKDSPLAGLKPEEFWNYFYEISKIPHGSGNEKALGDYVVSIAKKHKLDFKRDETGNIVVSKPGSSGHEKAPIVVLQSHLDMVCEKNKDVTFDFKKDSIKIKKEGNFVKAQGTSLGADNAVGIASSLAVMEMKDIVHPPLELLFTVDEETGMTGAKNLEPGFLKGRRLLNLDSEEEGDVYIGCSGGSDNVLRMPITRRQMISSEFEEENIKKTHIPYTVRMHGLKGGHSGLEIHEGRGNAIKLLGRFLWNSLDDLNFILLDISGGSKRNAIPREAEALIAIKPDREKQLNDLAKKWVDIFKNEYSPLEEGLKITVEKAKKWDPEKAFASHVTQYILDLINVISHGVISMSRNLKGLVETSTNFAIIREENDEIVIELSHRSSSATAIRSMDQKTASLARLFLLKYFRGNGYPGWQPYMKSEVLKIAKKTYSDLFKKEINVKAIHAGLECGLIGEKFPGMDMISFGPSLKDVHSPDEVINISSVELFWKFLVGMLKALA